MFKRGNDKGISLVIIIISIVAVLLVVGGIVFLINSGNDKGTEGNNQNNNNSNNSNSSASITDIYENAKKIDKLFRDNFIEYNYKGARWITENYTTSDEAKFEEAYNTYTTTLNEMKQLISQLDNQIKKSSNNELKQSWNEFISRYTPTISQVEEIFKVYYSVHYCEKNESKNISSLNISTLKEIRNGSNRDGGYNIATKLNINWYKESDKGMAISGVARSYINFDSFLSKVENIME